MSSVLHERRGAAGSPYGAGLASSGQSKAAASAAVVLDSDHQEAVVCAIETDATAAAAAWRAVFGGGAMVVGTYFLALSVRASLLLSGDSTDVWKGVVHREFYDVISPGWLAALDAATAAAALGAGGAALFPSQSTRGKGGTRHRVRVAVFVVAACAGALAAAGWASALSDVSRRHMLWLPALAAGTPMVAAYCYWQVEGTVVQARALRDYMYEHKRA
mmetsp:Transcript_6979/g.10916  ORF Transcript_6979/g.10916 Transcript_6979/m.10916 type:complete len:218 (-) Transcript_6979:561-1214(-)